MCTALNIYFKKREPISVKKRPEPRVLETERVEGLTNAPPTEADDIKKAKSMNIGIFLTSFAMCGGAHS